MFQEMQARAGFLHLLCHLFHALLLPHHCFWLLAFQKTLQQRWQNLNPWCLRVCYFQGIDQLMTTITD